MLVLYLGNCVAFDVHYGKTILATLIFKVLLFYTIIVILFILLYIILKFIIDRLNFL